MSEPAERVIDLIFGRWRSQVLYAGVELGIFEVLGEAPATAEAVTGELDLDPDNGYRLMRALAALGLLHESPDATFSITDAGAVLTEDHPRSLRGVARLEEGPDHYMLWTYLPEFVRTGEQDASEEVTGYAGFERLAEDREHEEIFSAAMTSFSRIETDAVLAALDPEDLSDVGHLCDVAGGRGYLLSQLLLDHPGMRGTVLEIPEVAEGAGAVPEEFGVADRVTFVEGDMFESVPRADGYVMKHVLHDWNDDECVEIMDSIREAAPSGAPVYVCELVVPGPEEPHFAKLFDIHMMVATTGRERTVEEYGELFERADMELAGHHVAEGQPMSVVEGRVV